MSHSKQQNGIAVYNMVAFCFADKETADRLAKELRASAVAADILPRKGQKLWQL